MEKIGLQPFMQGIYKLEEAQNLRCTMLGIGPMSENLIEAVFLLAKQKDFPVMFIASRNQVDADEFGGGYVCSWNQDTFRRDIAKIAEKCGYQGLYYLCRDHGGPWQRDKERNDKLPVREAMELGKRSYLYDLKAGQLAELPRLGEKSADNIIRSIRGSVEVPFRRVLFGLGIRFVGETTAKYLAEHFRSLDAVMRATREELVEADEVGGRIADAIIEYFAEEDNLRIIRRLRAAGLQFEAEARRLASEALAGRSFVVSGKFTRSRDEMKELIELHGGRNLAAVSGSVDYLVAGDKMGPAKLKKAEKLGVRIISEEEFIAMIEGGGPVEKAAQQELF